MSTCSSQYHTALCTGIVYSSLSFQHVLSKPASASHWSLPPQQQLRRHPTGSSPAILSGSKNARRPSTHCACASSKPKHIGRNAAQCWEPPWGRPWPSNRLCTAAPFTQGKHRSCNDCVQQSLLQLRWPSSVCRSAVHLLTSVLSSLCHQHLRLILSVCI